MTNRLDPDWDLKGVLLTDAVEQLAVALDEGLDPKLWLDADSATSILAIAALADSLACTELLLDRGADWSTVADFDEDLDSPLALVIERGSDRILRCFVDAKTVEKYPPAWLEDALARLLNRETWGPESVLPLLEAARDCTGGLRSLLSSSTLARNLARKAKKQLEQSDDRALSLRWRSIHSDLTSSASQSKKLLKEVEDLAATCHRSRTRELVLSLPAHLRRRAAGLALVYAADRNDWDFASELLELRADCTVQLAGGSTALMYAARGGNLALVRKLLSEGADLTAREDASRGGRTAFDMAESPLIRRYLEKAAEPTT